MADKSFPTSESDINLLFQTLKAKLPAHKAELGLTDDEITSQSNDADNFGYLITIAPQVSDSKESFFEYKDHIINGEISTVQPPAPTFPSVSPPEHPFPGIVKRARLLIKRIKSATGYTQQIGEDLGLVDNTGNAFVPDLLTAVLKLKAKPNSRVEITFSKQGQEAMLVEYKRKDDAKWNLAGTYTASPATHNLDPAVADEPETRQYRGTLIKKNDPVGNTSPSYTIVTTP